MKKLSILAALLLISCSATQDDRSTEKAAKEGAAIGPCGDVSYIGYCDGTNLVWCQDDQLMQFDCAGTGQICAYQDDNVGNNCLNAPPPSDGSTSGGGPTGDGAF